MSANIAKNRSVNMELAIQQRQFTSVEYPGVVQSSDKMLESLGGEHIVNQVFNTPGQRLELHFRPGDLFSKAACANRHATTNLVLRIRRRRKKSPDVSNVEGDDSGVEYEHSGEIIGTVESSYKFQSLADFQYLPMTRKPNTDTYEPLLPKIVFSKVEKPSWILQDMPLFLPPSLFSRIDNPSEYHYRDGPHKCMDESKSQNPNVISVFRQRRPHFTQIVTNEEWHIPDGPMPQALAKIESKQNSQEELKMLKELFDKRPVWSRIGVVINLGRPAEVVKLFLPCVAYYVVTGPWRRMWIRFGYDPKKNPEAKIYQVLDFRIKDKTLSKRLGISIKRSSTSYNLPNKMMKSNAITPKIEKDELANLRPEPEDPEKDKRISDSYYKFYPGLVPAYHQICYLFCDLEEEQVQKLVHANDGQEVECTDRDGWCLPHTTEKIRKILIDHLYAKFREKPGNIVASRAWTGSVNLRPETEHMATKVKTPSLPSRGQEPSVAEAMAVDSYDLQDEEGELNSEEEDMLAEGESSEEEEEVPEVM